uniref:Coiled-coil domain-containing protein 84 n=1 Tax=Pyxicephalus adspersus TaxID=30357 RepID=A0AAV2ZLE5_PYXAD|nr:TPA: hypothetical protein GDO54_003614 [Pyxicephalus adspersus]
MVVYECAVCRKSVFYSRRKHVYEKKHQEKLQAVLRSFADKVEAARKMISVAAVERFDPLEHEEKFWCYCCEEEVKKHTSDGNVAVLYGGMLEHIHSPEHTKAVNKFWWTHQADVKLKARFSLTTKEFERFKSSIIKALEVYEEKEDVLIKQMANHIQMVEQNRLEILQNALEVTTDKGNVHTGAVPPWMVSEEEEANTEIGPSLESFLKHREMMKLKKLPPNRVGANFDHTAPTDEGWLPSFGRVWNSGRRWQSRHQYRKESGITGKKRKRNEDV